MLIDIDLFRVPTSEILAELTSRAKTGQRKEYIEYSDNELYSYITTRMAPYNKKVKNV